MIASGAELPTMADRWAAEYDPQVEIRPASADDYHYYEPGADVILSSARRCIADLLYTAGYRVPGRFYCVPAIGVYDRLRLKWEGDD